MTRRPATNRTPAEAERIAARLAARPKIEYDDALPVSARREEIARAIAEHQVVVVCGETGSGKTTQLPKICLELGRGCAGLIGHTQPRRIAARATATRIAQELKSEIGRHEEKKVSGSNGTTLSNKRCESVGYSHPARAKQSPDRSRRTAGGTSVPNSVWR